MSLLDWQASEPPRLRAQLDAEGRIEFKESPTDRVEGVLEGAEARMDSQLVVHVESDAKPLNASSGARVQSVGAESGSEIRESKDIDDPSSNLDTKELVQARMETLGRSNFNFAVGLGEHQSTFEPTLLRNFSQHVNAAIYPDVFGGWDIPSWDVFERRIISACQASDGVKVNLDGVVTHPKELHDVIYKGKMLGADFGNITNWEIYIISEQFTDKAKFYFNGVEIKIDDYSNE